MASAAWAGMPCRAWVSAARRTSSASSSSAQVDQRGGQHEQGLDLAGVGGDPAAGACRVSQQFEPVADLALVPADHRPGDQGRHHHLAVVPVRGGEHGADQGGGQLGAQSGQRLQLRGHGLVPQAVGQLRLGQHHPGFGGGVPGLAAGAQHRGQSAPQPGLRYGGQRLGQGVVGDPGGLVQQAGRGQGLGGGYRPGQRARIAGRSQLQRPQRQAGGGLRRRRHRLRRRRVQVGQGRRVVRVGGLEEMFRG